MLYRITKEMLQLIQKMFLAMDTVVCKTCYSFCGNFCKKVWEHPLLQDYVGTSTLTSAPNFKGGWYVGRGWYGVKWCTGK